MYDMNISWSSGRFRLTMASMIALHRTNILLFCFPVQGVGSERAAVVFFIFKTPPVVYLALRIEERLHVPIVSFTSTQVEVKMMRNLLLHCCKLL